jgi:hypothetical protein
MFTCSDCTTKLTDDNWYPSLKKIGRKICKLCNSARNTAWRKAHPERASQHTKKYYWQNPEPRRQKRREYFNAHREYERARGAAYDRQLKDDLIAAYGGQCACCGDKHREFLTIDHINGDGKPHRAAVSNGRTNRRLYLWFKRNAYPKDGYRLLCMNCNFSFGHCGYCPHQTTPTSSEPSVDLLQIP